MSPNNPSRTSLDRHPTAALQLFNEVIGSTHAALQRERRLLGEASRLACDVAGQPSFARLVKNGLTGTSFSCEFHISDPGSRTLFETSAVQIACC
jgi:hypothetical protein